MLVMSLKSQNEVATTSMWAWPRDLTFGNFREVWSNPNVSFLLFLKNTTFITTIVTIGVVLSSSIVAYAFARLDFAGRDRLFLVLLATMMLPGIVTMIPSYVMFAKIGWVNTFYPLTVPAFFGSAFFIFLLRQFYMGIPREMDEAALLDGAGHWTIFSRIIVPNSKPSLITVGLFTVMGTWRDFMGPLIYLNDPEKQTLEQGLRTYMTLRAEKWHLLMAGSVLVIVPLIIIFFIGQRYFVKGIVMTGGK
jgi:ABC-type glycerol-3-phosphate transport system permease component